MPVEFHSVVMYTMLETWSWHQSHVCEVHISSYSGGNVGGRARIDSSDSAPAERGQVKFGGGWNGAERRNRGGI